MRHRIASYSQQSQRYVKYDELDWVIPDYAIDKDFARHICDITLDAYKELADENNPGFQKSIVDAARCVLPNATPTVIYVTMNIRGLMNFFNERLCTRASKEIREMAEAMRFAILNADDIPYEQGAIFKTIFVPKCEKFSIHACPEKDGCGKYKSLKEFVWRSKAKWQTYYANMGGGEECSACGFNGGIKTFKFCPMCGAEIT